MWPKRTLYRYEVNLLTYEIFKTEYETIDYPGHKVYNEWICVSSDISYEDALLSLFRIFENTQTGMNEIKKKALKCN